MRIPSHLKSFQALELAARTGSFAAAAQLLGITPAAVGQRVKALEDYLGVDLIVRGRSGILPTEALRKAIPHLASGFAAIEAAAALLDMQRPQELHIAALPDFAELWLAPRLPAFRAAYPNIRLCVNGEGDVPLRLGHVDCEIGFEPPPHDEAMNALLFHDFVLPVASEENVARTLALPSEARLEGFPLLHLDFYKDDPAGMSWSNWFAGNGIVRSVPERGMRFMRIAGALNSVLANSGVALCGIVLLEALLADGRLGLPYPVATGRRSGHAYVAKFRQPRTTARTADIFREWLVGEARKTADWLEFFIAH